MRKFLLYIWQLPQHFVALIILLFNIRRFKKESLKVGEDSITYYKLNNFFNSGVSLGDYILLDKSRCLPTTIKHEAGHSHQSRVTGPFYLIIIGAPSVLRNIWDRLFHKNWTQIQRVLWYYRSGFPNGYPEKQADKYFGVQR